jgi:signal transduction histidine kinase
MFLEKVNMQIRTRLTLIFLGIGGLIMVGASIAIYYSSSNFREAAFHERLRDKARSITMLILEPNRVHDIDKYNPDKLYDERIVMVNSFDVIVYSTNHDLTFKIDHNTVNQIWTYHQDLYYVYGPYEVLGTIYTVKNNHFVVFVAAIDKEGFQHLDKLKTILILVCLVSLILFFIAGWFYSGRALKPISDVVNRVENISISSLNLRVPEGNGTDEIGRLAKTFNKMLERLETSFAMQKDFIANASHELRTPLTSINGQLDVLLMKDRTTNDYKTAVMSVLEDIRSLIDLSNRLLLIARTSAEGPVNLNKNLRIDEILWQSREEILKFNKSYNVNISIGDSLTDSDQMIVVGDESLLKVAISNIIENGCKYSPDHKVNVEIGHAEKRIVINFEDQGIGIPEKDIQKVFEPFYRSSNAHSYNGSGIGLPLVKQIIANYNGKIELASKVGKGTCVTVFLPSK